MITKMKKQIPLAVLILAVIVFPLVADGYVLSIGIAVMISALLGQSWNLMSGYAGQFSFGHATFFGLGAYTSAILYMDFGTDTAAQYRTLGDYMMFYMQSVNQKTAPGGWNTRHSRLPFDGIIQIKTFDLSPGGGGSGFTGADGFRFDMYREED